MKWLSRLFGSEQTPQVFRPQVFDHQDDIERIQHEVYDPDVLLVLRRARRKQQALAAQLRALTERDRLTRGM